MHTPKMAHPNITDTPRLRPFTWTFLTVLFLSTPMVVLVVVAVAVAVDVAVVVVLVVVANSPTLPYLLPVS